MKSLQAIPAIVAMLRAFSCTNPGQADQPTETENSGGMLTCSTVEEVIQ